MPIDPLKKTWKTICPCPQSPPPLPLGIERFQVTQRHCHALAQVLVDTLLDDPNQRSSGGVTMLMNAANSGCPRACTHTILFSIKNRAVVFSSKFPKHPGVLDTQRWSGICKLASHLFCHLHHVLKSKMADATDQPTLNLQATSIGFELWWRRVPKSMHKTNMVPWQSYVWCQQQWNSLLSFDSMTRMIRKLICICCAARWLAFIVQHHGYSILNLCRFPLMPGICLLFQIIHEAL